MNQQDFLKKLQNFQNKWVALVDNEVIASGDTVKETKDNADQTGRREYVFYFVPSSATSFALAISWG